MKFYLAPMEGLTTYIYRTAYHRYFHPMDKYFTPFIVPHINKDFNSREKNEILPEHNRGQNLIPQILTNNAADFLRTANALRKFGYEEVNLNLGCPSKTVVSKGRGSGFLAKTQELDQFLDTIFSETDINVSIKTRIGKDSSEEFYELITIFNKYPLTELIVHPRTQQDFYKNKPNLDIFADTLKLCRHHICYNGHILTREDYINFVERFPSVDTLMVGRGILGNPGLLNDILKQKPVDIDTLRMFHDELYANYQGIFSGDRNVLFKMKELWSYMIQLFPESEKYAKKIRKSERLWQYERAVSDLFSLT
ncbi:tRNA-dihydrouridine synthase family protein [Ruminococcus sp. OA3]|uniref:tRNA dihydrouridine synthase n=1 Tax=Ruminococcus sp. OA3 TaxID=2914164 RepID=UPI001F06632B|nr:tRNA-dihydrouridine synthase family protein [Ruminococcus sp. OA3]MCH1981601.1 tRNA-dihydrouridine synthase family protein [Ruminococcus sp. OA3]